MKTSFLELLPSFASAFPRSQWEQNQITATPEFANIDYSRILTVFSGKHTRFMFDRQQAVLVKLYKIYSNCGGLVKSDLSNLAKVLKLAMENICNSGNLESEAIRFLLTPCEKLLTLASFPFAQNSSGEEMASADNVSIFATALAQITSIKIGECAQLAAKALLHLAEGRIPADTAMETIRIVINHSTIEQTKKKRAQIAKSHEIKARSEKDTHFLQLERSSAIKNLIKSLEIQSNFDKVLIDILKVLKRMSTSFQSANQMTGGESVRTFLRVLETTNDLSVFTLQTEIIWNLLTFKTKSNIANVLNEEFKNLRNEFAIIVLTIADLCSNFAMESFQSGFTDTVARYLMSHELGALSEILKLTNSDTLLFEPVTEGKKKYIYIQSNQDYEFKKVLMQLAMKLCVHELNLVKLLNTGLLEFLLLYLECDPANSGVQVWNERQLQGLQIQTISFLNSLIPRIPQKWSNANGNSILLEYLSETLKRKLNHGDTTLPAVTVPDTEQGSSKQGLGMNMSAGLVGGALRLLSRISELGPSQKRALGVQGAFGVLMGCKSNKNLFGQCGGVDMILPFLTYSSADPQETESVVLAAVECIWGSICGSASNEAALFSVDGIKARSHVLEWRSAYNEQTGVAHLLISLWNSEEQRLGVPNGPLGLLVDEKNPLLGKNQTVHDENSKDGFVVEELTENLRAKIYSMFCKLGFDRFGETITAQEQIKLALIAKYLDFKIGQVWQEISDELDSEGIRPISPDLHCINTAKQVIIEKARAIQLKQADIVGRKNDTERAEEDVFYATYIKQRATTPRLPKFSHSK
ncbi:hypothetical protein HK100_006830 [Physocladia obscura]|uniref:Cilia- and flagella-associated protein 69 ARM repeats domain-containing protein n=1 Tax=Physocladia obscura TaxID=109957 RepID=A0AAD5XG16_9FUNG|nr:hypothetical protein HK100_006830 [Physocladia obscura]